jgi:hypothetical protein
MADNTPQEFDISSRFAASDYKFLVRNGRILQGINGGVDSIKATLTLFVELL